MKVSCIIRAKTVIFSFLYSFLYYKNIRSHGFEHCCNVVNCFLLLEFGYQNSKNTRACLVIGSVFESKKWWARVHICLFGHCSPFLFFKKSLFKLHSNSQIREQQKNVFT